MGKSSQELAEYHVKQQLAEYWIKSLEKKFERPLTGEEKASIRQGCAAIRILGPQHIWDTGTKYPNYG
jgi:hypothetical protein